MRFVVSSCWIHLTLVSSCTDTNIVMTRWMTNVDCTKKKMLLAIVSVVRMLLVVQGVDRNPDPVFS